MAYKLKRLNVVKIVESVSERDALLDKGFEEVKEKKSPSKKDEKE